LHRHAHLNAIRHLLKAVRVLVLGLSTEERIHVHAAKTLSMRHGAVLVCKKQCLEVDDLLSQLGDSRRQRVVLCTEELDFGLQIREPLLLALATLERGDPDIVSI
jgi:hypothetical protein